MSDPSHTPEGRLRQCVDEALTAYFQRLEGDSPANLHALMLEEVEQALFARVLDRVDGNQRAAAGILGINRATLRKKARHYGLISTESTTRR